MHSGAILLCSFTATTNQNSPRRKKARWCLFTGRLVCAHACLDAQGPGCDSAEQWRLSGSGLRPACKQHIKRSPLLKKTSRGQEHEIFAQESTHLSTKMSMEDPFFVVKGWVYGLDRLLWEKNIIYRFRGKRIINLKCFFLCLNFSVH